MRLGNPGVVDTQPFHNRNERRKEKMGQPPDTRNPGPSREPSGLPGTRPRWCHVIMLSACSGPGDKGEGRRLGTKKESFRN